jgi:hypothetical protein
MELFDALLYPLQVADLDHAQVLGKTNKNKSD